MINSLPKSLVEDASYLLESEIYESLLLENRIQFLKNQNPTLSDTIDKYSGMDSSPTKKFVPWLVSQHKKGNITPETSNISDVISNFDKYKSKHGIKDHSQKSFQEVENAVVPLLGTAATKRQQAQETIHSGVEKIHAEGNIKAFKIRTKEASQELYGGGQERNGESGGARGTNWCVSARSDVCLFNTVHGDMYTIHNKNDDRAPYAVHPHKNTITSRFNDGDKDIDEVLKEKPELHNAISKIRERHENKSEQDLLDDLNPENSDDIKLTTLKNKNINSKHIDKALDDTSKYVRGFAASHPSATKEHIDKALTDSDSYVRGEAITNPNITKAHLDKAINDDNEYIHIGVINNPNSTKEHLDKAINAHYFLVRKAVASHPNATKEHLDKALNDSHEDVRMAAIRNPNITKEHIDKALNDSDRFIKTHAASHPNATKENLDKALNDESDYIRGAAASNPNATKENLDKALDDESNYVRKEAVLNPNVTKEHLDKALNDPHKGVRENVSGHPSATKEHLDKALNDPHEDVRREVASNPNATKEHLDKALNDSDYYVRRAAAKNPRAKEFGLV